MESHVWIIGQSVVDIIMIFIIFWFIRTHQNKQLDLQNHEQVLQRSESLLSEMREISLVLEKNLAEKKDLSRRILDQLDEGLKRAEEAYRQISGIVPKSGIPPARNAEGADDTEHLRSSVQALMEKGLSKGEISRHLGISIGEIDLLIKLQPGRGEGS
jgi:hypothetical protein